MDFCSSSLLRKVVWKSEKSAERNTRLRKEETHHLQWVYLRCNLPKTPIFGQHQKSHVLITVTY